MTLARARALAKKTQVPRCADHGPSINDACSHCCARVRVFQEVIAAIEQPLQQQIATLETQLIAAQPVYSRRQLEVALRERRARVEQLEQALCDVSAYMEDQRADIEFVRDVDPEWAGLIEQVEAALASPAEASAPRETKGK